MSETPTPYTPSPTEVKEIDQICDRFEAAWLAGERPRLEDYFAEMAVPARSYLLRHLVLMDWDYRRRAGDEPSAADYRGRFPGSDAVIDEVSREMSQRSFFDAPTADQGVTASQPAAGEGPGAVVGPYRLLERIGEGGFGVVYLAEQTEPVRRKVALKLIKPGMDTQQVVVRFEAERQALAIMDHPNIARVFDGGTTTSGRPFFVMELVRGIPITDFCDQNHLAPRQRLELFQSVCSAVQHAHQKGIIHRDLKPSNVLVSRHDATPVVKVIDFGVAKALGPELTDKTLFTGPAQMVGTPLYMSPEQAGMSGMDVDSRSDVYSLGVLLYELLTGTTPFTKERFNKAAYDEIRRIIREEEPPSPSTRLSESKVSLPSVAAQRQTEPAKLTKLVRGELDWIVMKALDKDRNRRYETANNFAMDVQRYLADEPVLAGPPSARYRLRKFSRRHRTAMLLTTLIAAALLLGTALATWQAIVATKANKVALEAKTLAETKDTETESVLKFVEDHILSAARPKSRLGGGLGSDVSLRAAIDAALPFVDKDFNDRPLTEARVRRTLGATFQRQGDGKAAGAQFERVRAIYTQHLGAEHIETLTTAVSLSIAYGLQNRFADSIKISEEILPIAEAQFGSDGLLTLQVMNNLGKAYFDLGDYERALAIHKDVLAAKTAKFGASDRSTLITMLNLANAYHRLGKYDDALKMRMKTLDLQRATLGPKEYDTLMTQHNIGVNYRRLERYADALRTDEETLRLRTEVLTRDHPDTLSTISSVASDFIHLDRGAEALPLLDECLQRSVGKIVPFNLADVADRRLRLSEKAKDPQGCRHTAELWERQNRTDADSLFNAACYRAVTAATFKVDPNTPGADATRLAKEEADRAMTWLRKAVAEGFMNVEQMKQTKDLDALREREDFKRLLAELESKKK